MAQSCLTLRPHGLYSLWNSPGQNTGVGSLSLLQGIFPTQASNPGLKHCRQILYQLSHRGSPRILEWVAFPSPGNLPDPGIELESPALQADSLPTGLPGKPSPSLPEFKSTELMTPSNHLTLSFGLRSFPASGAFPMSWLRSLGGP